MRYCLLQASISLSIMFGAYVLHAWAQPYMHRENIPSVFYEVVNHELLATKEVRLISAKQKELKNMAKLAKQKIVRYVFNYNLA